MKQIKTSRVAGATALVCGLALAGEPSVQIEFGAARAEVTAPGWDTEGTGREKTNLLRPRRWWLTKQDDDTDTFGQYQNGGITAAHDLHFLAAHDVVGDPEPADKIPRAMLERQGRGEFQNGVRDAGGGVQTTGIAYRVPIGAWSA